METRRLRVHGIVQGVGFRPAVARLAAKYKLTGNVSNRGPFVEIFLQGESSAIDELSLELRENSPERAEIIRIEEEHIEASNVYDTFSIVESEKTTGEIYIPPDIAICEKCAEELFDPKDRRYLHPFINCTSCGPRLTILEHLPYDRERTSMKHFPMCEKCAEEYRSPKSRRYDAQPVCCNDCGPEVYVLEKNGDIKIKGSAAILKVREVLRNGGIAAVKGIGGFHLCCDASDEAAVRLLRQRKHRPVKPFAVMAADEKAVRRIARVEPEMEPVLKGHQKPIILMRRLKDSGLADSLCPGNPKIGIMLPYTPLHMLLFKYPDGKTFPGTLVMTSGNVSGAPICVSDDEVLRELSGFVDIILSHDREILTRADDSVMDFYRKKPYMIRRSRGYAPLPYQISSITEGEVLAVGGELKNTFCIGKNGLMYPSAYIGDLADVRSLKVLEKTADRMKDMLESNPEIVACDLHPAYHSTEFAESIGKEVFKVQHHYAHILSCMAENDVSEKVIGAAFDGTGYGTDGNIWGGELLLADPYGFKRAGSIVPFRQVGGDGASKAGWKIAASMISSLYGKEAASEIVENLHITDRVQLNVIAKMAEKGLNTVTSTSAGRLFDAVSAVLGIVRESTFEGEASTALQYTAERCKNRDIIQLPELITENNGFVNIRTDNIFRQIVEDRSSGMPIEKCAYEFHAWLAEGISEALIRIRNLSEINIAALSGGVFQNTLLLGLVEAKAEAAGLKVLKHSLVPPNDGGIALGQAFAAAAKLQQRAER
ncbi:MAG: carbamoyltransferase HypF [Lachnospiraceae bacterium]|nr:carbamoyltransferase HypF [Lachnospiraceae bacterium]